MRIASFMTRGPARVVPAVHSLGHPDGSSESLLQSLPKTRHLISRCPSISASAYWRNRAGRLRPVPTRNRKKLRGQARTPKVEMNGTLIAHVSWRFEAAVAGGQVFLRHLL